MTPIALERTNRGGVAEAKANLSSIVAQVERSGEPYVIMRYNRPIAVIEPWEERHRPSVRARGMLASYANAAMREQEESAFARAMVVKHANPS